MSERSSSRSMTPSAYSSNRSFGQPHNPQTAAKSASGSNPNSKPSSKPTSQVSNGSQDSNASSASSGWNRASSPATTSETRRPASSAPAEYQDLLTSLHQLTTPTIGRRPATQSDVPARDAAASNVPFYASSFIAMGKDVFTPQSGSKTQSEGSKSEDEMESSNALKRMQGTVGCNEGDRHPMYSSFMSGRIIPEPSDYVLDEIEPSKNTFIEPKSQVGNSISRMGLNTTATSSIHKPPIHTSFLARPYTSHFLSVESAMGVPPSESEDLAENHDISTLFASEYEIEAIGAQFDKEYSTFRKSLMSTVLQTKTQMMKRYKELIERERKLGHLHAAQKQEKIEENKERIASLMCVIEYKENVENRMAENIFHHGRKFRGARELTKAFHQWRAFSQYNKIKEAKYRSAKLHYRKKLLHKIIMSWRSVAYAGRKLDREQKWEEKVDDVTNRLIADYESRIRELMSELHEAKVKIQESEQENQRLQDHLKGAFLKGVCALNLEAMSLMKPNGNVPVPMSASDPRFNPDSVYMKVERPENIGYDPSITIFRSPSYSSKENVPNMMSTRSSLDDAPRSCVPSPTLVGLPVSNYKPVQHREPSPGQQKPKVVHARSVGRPTTPSSYLNSRS